MAFADFDEASGSPVLTVQPNFKRARRWGRCSWTNTSDLIDELFPASGILTPSAFPGHSDLLASSLTIEPSIGEKDRPTSPTTSDLTLASINAYGDAKVTIEYETPRYDATQGEDPTLLLTHRWAIGGEFLTLESYGLQWTGGDDVARDVTAGMLIPTIEHQITWHRVQYPPFNVIRSRIGCVNYENMTFNTGTIYPETLLFLGAELQRDILSSGALAWQVTYRFSERRVPLPATEGPYCTLLNGTIDDQTTQAQCTTEGGTWTAATTPDTIGGVGGETELNFGGWNHFFRTEDTSLQWDPDLQDKRGFYRLQLKQGTAPQNAIYKIKSFSPLFVPSNQ